MFNAWIRKGEEGTLVQISRPGKAGNHRPMLTNDTVFNGKQIEGLPCQNDNSGCEMDYQARIERIFRFANIRVSGTFLTEAFYSCAGDEIVSADPRFPPEIRYTDVVHVFGMFLARSSAKELS